MVRAIAPSFVSPPSSPLVFLHHSSSDVIPHWNLRRNL